MPRIPETGWTSPTEFPNLSGAKIIGFDTETWDPELRKAGPGWGRGKGHIIGASLSVEDGSSWYFPIRHGIEDGKQILPPDEAALNMDPSTVLRYLNHVLHDNRPKCGANLIYDVGWLNWEGVRVGGRLYDVQFAEALLDSETPGVDLDSLGEKYLGMGKVTNDLYQFLADWCGGRATERQREHLYISPPSLAGPYAEADASLPIQILNRQWPLLHQRGVLELFDLECRLIPLMVAMRMKGAPVNIQKAESVYDEIGRNLDGINQKVHDMVGQPVNPNAGESLKSAFKRLGLDLPTKVDKKTGETKISFDKDRLKAVEHPVANLILNYRELYKVQSTFVKGYIMDKQVNSRIFTSFHPLKGLENGARSGRFASSDPNLQNIPIRTEIGKRVRDMFDASVFGARWRSFDYSSVEYRLLVHFAVGQGSDEVRAQFAAKPDTDYHDFVAQMIHRMVGLELARGKTKTINFGIIYGMALNALATALGLSKQEANKLLKAYHEAIPYARETMDWCANEVHTTGQVRTLLGRVSDFNQWGPKGYQEEGRSAPMSYERACRKWGMYNIERQHTHKALNRKLQGSAADVMKKAMVEAYEAGLFADDACGIPILTVHDELDFEDHGDLDNPAWSELKYLMENCASHLLRVPLLVDGDVGNTWAEAH
jgi:DNA polymerase-1